MLKFKPKISPNLSINLRVQATAFLASSVVVHLSIFKGLI